jgi:hypothetical protein
MSDPRDLGFNYGPGWGSQPKPPVYLRAAKLSRVLARRLAEQSAKAWRLEMALRNVRLATTGVEKAIAITELSSELAQFGEGANVLIDG